MKLRILGIGLSVAVLLYGVAGFLSLQPEDIRAAVIWGIGGLLLHDLFFAPLVLGTGHLVGRLPRPIRRGTQVAGIVAGSALLATAPTWLAVGQGNAEPGALPLNYTHSLLVVLAGATLLGITTGLVDHLRTRQPRRISEKSSSGSDRLGNKENTTHHKELEEKLGGE